jgi:hypothetical protein
MSLSILADYSGEETALPQSKLLNSKKVSEANFSPFTGGMTSL